MLFLVHPETYASTVSLEKSNNSKNVDKSSSNTPRGQEERTGMDIDFVSLDIDFVFVTALFTSCAQKKQLQSYLTQQQHPHSAPPFLTAVEVSTDHAHSLITIMTSNM